MTRASQCREAAEILACGGARYHGQKAVDRPRAQERRMPDYQESPDGFGPEMFTFPYGQHIFVLARPLTEPPS